MKHIIPISGKDSLTTAIVQINRQPNLNYEFIYNDTGAELPETYEWINKIEQQLNIKINKIGESLIDIMHLSGFLPSQKARYCTRLSKIHPMEKFIGKDESIIYIGLRADEPLRVGYQSTKNIKAVYPLREMNINIDLVYKILDKFELEPPSFFWKDIYDRTIKKIDENIIKKLPRYIFNMLFSWRSRPNCYFCFNQRLYEWIGLYEHHPELFEISYGLETEIGSSEYTFNKKENLVSIILRAEEIKNKRVNQIISSIYKYIETPIFEENDLLNQTSCGFLCGK